MAKFRGNVFTSLVIRKLIYATKILMSSSPGSVSHDHFASLTTTLSSHRPERSVSQTTYDTRTHIAVEFSAQEPSRQPNNAYVTNNFSSTHTGHVSTQRRKCRSDADKCILACYPRHVPAARSAGPFVYRIFIRKLYCYARSRSPCHCSSSLRICQSVAFNRREAEETLFLERT